jgi:hypothetical protein
MPIRQERRTGRGRPQKQEASAWWQDRCSGTARSLDATRAACLRACAARSDRPPWGSRVVRGRLLRLGPRGLSSGVGTQRRVVSGSHLVHLSAKAFARTVSRRCTTRHSAPW